MKDYPRFKRCCIADSLSFDAHAREKNSIVLETRGRGTKPFPWNPFPLYQSCSPLITPVLMAARTFSFLPISLPNSQKPLRSSLLLPLTTFHGSILQIKDSNYRYFVLNCHGSMVPTVLSSLPTK